MINKLLVKFSKSPIVAKLNGRVGSYGDKDLPARLLAHRFIEQYIKSNNSPAAKNDLIYPSSSFIFIYWAQGFDSAPSIVRACLRRLYALNPSMQIVELDDRNLKEWVSIPRYILCNSNISKTHFSDILRLALLAKHGGVWIDATCYCCKPLDSLMEKVGDSFFAYTRADHSMLSNWFLISRKDNIIAVLMRNAIYDYYQKNSNVPHYFFFHYLFEALYHANTLFRMEWDRRLVESSDSAHILQGLLFMPYEENLFADVLKETHVQKLTYKLTKSPKYDSFYFSICRIELPDEEVKFVKYRDRSRLQRRLKKLFMIAAAIIILYFIYQMVIA